MATEDFSDNSSASRSRFAYHSDDDEPQEGGVRTVSPAAPPRKSGSNITTPAPGSRSSVSGIPGPAEKLLDISELARTLGMHYTHRFSFPPGQQDDLENVAPIVGQITLTNTGAILLLQGHVETVLRLEDSRTLEPLDQPVETELEEEFELVAKTNASFRQDEVLVVDEDTPAAVIDGNVLNLAELLRQNLLLAAPLQPVRDEDAIPLGAFVYRDAPEEEAAPANPLWRLGELLQAKQEN